MRSRHGSICDLRQRCSTPSRDFMFRIFPAVRHVRVARLHSVCLKSRASLRGVLLSNSWLGRGLHIRARGIMNSGSEGCVPYISPLQCFARMDFQFPCFDCNCNITPSSERQNLSAIVITPAPNQQTGRLCMLHGGSMQRPHQFSATRHACRTEETLN